MLRKVRQILAGVFFVCITLLFLDFTGTLHAWFGWMAKVQFWPAALALNFGVVGLWVVLTLLFGRVYCSVVCPLGVFQDVVSRLSGRRKGKKNRFGYSPERRWLRYGVLAVFLAALVGGVHALVALLAPYSAYGRIASQLLQPLWLGGNNLLALLAERMDSYLFYSAEVWLKSVPVLLVAVATVLVLVPLAWRNGRTYCNTVCPVGTILSFFARFALFRPRIDAERCNGCGLCARRCKAACINSKEHRIDYGRCVACMDCVDTCRRHAITYRRARKTDALPAAPGALPETRGTLPGASDAAPGKGVDAGRRRFLTATTAVAVSAVAQAQEKKVDGGLAVIEDKQVPRRATRVVPAGAVSLRNFERRCTACQLCVSACPNGVLRPSSDLSHLLQPEMSFERGACRPECTKCSEVCPAGAILPVTRADKSATLIGRAVWIRKNCIPLTAGHECGNCARHCPSQAIEMVPSVSGDPNAVKIPVVNTWRCIGCGTCEFLCPSRPFSAIYVEGYQVHRKE